MWFYLGLNRGLLANNKHGESGALTKVPGRVQICVQTKRKSSCDLSRNCLVFNLWSHLGLNQGLPANNGHGESGALTNVGVVFRFVFKAKEKAATIRVVTA